MSSSCPAFRHRYSSSLYPIRHDLYGDTAASRVPFHPSGSPLLEIPMTTVQWFGRKTQLPQGPWRIALRTGAALLPTFIVRRPDNSYFLEISAPIKIRLYNDLVKDVQLMAQAWARCWEARVRHDPSQWEVFYPIWNN